MLRALFLERHITPSEDLIPYLLPRIERSTAAARQVVETLDDAGLSRRREVNRALAIAVLEIDNRQNDLFDDAD